MYKKKIIEELKSIIVNDHSNYIKKYKERYTEDFAINLLVSELYSFGEPADNLEDIVFYD